MNRVPFVLLSLLLATVIAGCGNETDGTSDPLPPDWWTDTRADDVGVDAPDTVDVEDEEEEEDTAPPRSDDGEPCSADDECLGRTCMPDDAWPDGYCTAKPCEDDDDCSADDVVCSSFDGEALCLLTCDSDDTCRDGYWCAPATGRAERVCVPGEPPPPPTGAVDGEPCESDDECIGGSCLQDPEWPGGYCSTVGCSNFGDCARGQNDEYDNRCLVQQSTPNFCVRLCETVDDCRGDEGYVCQGIGGGTRICVPGETSTPPRDINFDDYPFEVVCELAHEDGYVNIDFEIAEETTAYMIVPIARDGAAISPTHISRPGGDQIDFRGARNAFQLTPTYLFGFLNPIIVPATAQLGDQVQAGAHQLVVETYSEDLCWYLLEESEGGATLDINVYLVGLDGVTAETAPDDPNFSEVFAAFESIYAPAGVTIGELRYFDPPEDIIEMYQIIRYQTDVEYLVEQTDRPGETADDALSLNVFFVRAFSFADGSGVLGISMGLPGAAGAHGTRSSGVAFTSEFLGADLGGGVDGNDYTGVVLAHEVGHYLGLFHTSEQFGAGFDPLPDTAECRRNFPDGCPDLNNLMFPLAGVTHTEVSDDQVWQILVNPLTKP